MKRVKPRILIICEGEVTERRYFLDLKEFAKNKPVDVEISREVGEPLKAVQIAVRLRHEADVAAERDLDPNQRYDQVWTVFDVDEHATLNAARQLAGENGIQLAISNPCFELWALLHFQEQRAHIERRPLVLLLQRHLPEYDKTLAFAKLHPTYVDAVRRAEELEQEAERQDETGRNPTTGVYRLTAVILTE